MNLKVVFFGNEIQLAVSQPVLQAISGISVVQKFFEGFIITDEMLITLKYCKLIER